ncbi:unnamed protein product, partial [marine sediment metagenome]
MATGDITLRNDWVAVGGDDECVPDSVAILVSAATGGRFVTETLRVPGRAIRLRTFSFNGDGTVIAPLDEQNFADASLYSTNHMIKLAANIYAVAYHGEYGDGPSRYLKITTFNIDDATGAIVGIIDTQTVSYWEGGGLHGWAGKGFMCLGPNNHIVIVF